jgi:8-oxo-dGTP diphosphatase
MNTPQSIGTCVVLTNTNNQILLGKRKNSYKAGYFGLPGGRIELNEKIESAIARETLEETGLSNLDFKYVGVVRENQSAYDFIHFVFTASVENQQPKLCEPDKCESWVWFDSKSKFDLVLPGHKAAIDLVRESGSLADLTS